MIDFSKIRTYPIAERSNKFKLDAMLTPADAENTADVDGVRELASCIREAKSNQRPVVAMLGGAVIKEGCGALLIDLMNKGWIDHVSGNGSVSIHDFEIALIGETSEHVPNGLVGGMFGMAEETGRMMNDALRRGAADGIGYGEAIGRMIEEDRMPHREYSLLCHAVKLGRPTSIHVAVGGDIIHQHPHCDGAALGATTFHDFKLITEVVTQLKGGVVLNVGSAVIMPEVFLKALTIARNLGHDVSRFVTANFDFIDMYRPRTRVVEWPKVLECRGFDIRGHHRQTLAALHRALTLPT